MCPLFGGFTVIHVSGKALKNGENSPATYGGTLSYETCRQAFALCTKLLVDVVSLSIFGGNFVLAKVCLGLISVRWEVSASQKFKMWLVYGKIRLLIHSVRCTEVVRFLEGSLLQFLLYIEHKPQKNVKEWMVISTCCDILMDFSTVCFSNSKCKVWDSWV